MKKAKITGDIAPVNCPKCGSNAWSFYRSYTTSTRPKLAKWLNPPYDVPINLMTCVKCKSIQGFAVYFKLNFADGIFNFGTIWEPMIVKPQAMTKRRVRALK